MAKCRLGEIKPNNQGCLMKIIEYKNFGNIVVEFQDNYKYRVKTNYGNFKKGAINNKYFRIGELHKTNEGCQIVIINKNNNLYLIQFQDEHKYEKWCQYDTILKGNIKNPYYKSVVGVGSIGLTLTTNNNGTQKKSYKMWKHIIERCYSKKDKMYYRYGGVGIIVCDEWLCYANFEKWFDDNYYECLNDNIEIDKDILSNEQNKCYSPETCVFVPKHLNDLFRERNDKKTKLPLWVNKDKNKYRVVGIDENGNKINLGRFYKLEEAENVGKIYKTKRDLIALGKYKDIIPISQYNKIYEKLKERRDNIERLCKM